MENPSSAYCMELIQLADTRSDIILITADSSDPIGLGPFIEKHPDRYYDAGIAEQAMTNIAAGFASVGFTPFVSAFAMFQALRAGENIRNGIAYPSLNVKMISANISIHVGKNGATHHALEDMALMRAIPNMTVVSPADAPSTRKLIRQIADLPGPVYVRLDKNPIPLVYDSDEEIVLGKGKILKTGNDVAILATGSTVSTSLEAAKRLSLRGISTKVVDIHTIKPLDEDLIISCARDHQAVVTVEPHSIIGGLGGAVSELLGSSLPTPIERVGIRDRFTESGSAGDLMIKYGLHGEAVIDAVEKVLQRKRGS